jgi:predicted DCC family thiol-disulfide oxidoreductase YuxK
MHPVILFDGVCNFCDASVQFILKRDHHEVFYFASQQSEVGQTLLEKYNVPGEIESIVLIENDKAYFKSAAALRISRHLRGAWKLLSILMIIPSPIRNFVYDLIARNRYKWFGKKDSCMLPPENVRKRFL